MNGISNKVSLTEGNIQNIDEIAQAGAKKANKIASENLLIIQKAFGLK